MPHGVRASPGHMTLMGSIQRQGRRFLPAFLPDCLVFITLMLLFHTGDSAPTSSYHKTIHRGGRRDCYSWHFLEMLGKDESHDKLEPRMSGGKKKRSLNSAAKRGRGKGGGSGLKGRFESIQTFSESCRPLPKWLSLHSLHASPPALHVLFPCSGCINPHSCLD